MAHETVLIVLSAFIPCILFAALARWTEVHERQSVRSVIMIFVMGATISVLLALFLEVSGQLLLVSVVGIEAQGLISAFFGAVLLAPIIEEYAKSVPVRRAARRNSEFAEVEDGLVYGAAAGFGFAASENLLYFFVAWRQSLLLPAELGFASLLTTMIVRTTGAACLHGAASSILGYGIAKSTFLRGSWLPEYGKAVGLHAVFNFSIFTFNYLLACGLGPFCPAPLAFSLVMGIGFFRMTLKRIRRLDAEPNVQPVYEWKDAPPDVTE